MDMRLDDQLTLSDRVKTIIEDAIASTEIKPGERIIEADLVRRMGISKSPVREALKRLVGDGIIEHLPRKGYFAKDIDRKSIEAFTDLLFIFEPAVAVLALKRSNERTSKEIDGLLSQMQDCLSKNDYQAYSQVADQFHNFFYEISENEWIINISRSIRREAKVLRSLSLYTHKKFSDSYKSHRMIAKAFKAKDKKRLSEAIREDIQVFKETVLQSDFVKERKNQ